ncbi:hypothetical protein B4092_4808 [Bacillus licheniformis]|uniref:hypothetical protein n=1 Tax=Bacillus licheniformis TaxID=1402 RepID=UPI000779C37E|nr:hypothetical protein [Bacillus licheniformis]KYC77071.1 hypothetical protein B4092_4808 [Bacillus licheniformis]MDE1407044.1 hypothetical protein [Bacillus licheniformis]TWN76582.1 hypothetical protein CHCC20494_0645 [Bacillus licheniformis]
MPIKAEEVVVSLNSLMESRGSIVRFKTDRGRAYLPSIEIVIYDDYIDSFIINMDDKFYNELANHLKAKFKIFNISFNNTRSCFWHQDIV